jgi:hypothetical protein
MKRFRPGNSAEIDNPGHAEIEGDLRDVLRRDVTGQHRENELITHSVRSVVQRTATTSIQEIDNLIADLQMMREYLRSESERVQRQIGRYSHLNHSTLASTKVIADTIASWKGAHENARN